MKFKALFTLLFTAILVLAVSQPTDMRRKPRKKKKKNSLSALIDVKKDEAGDPPAFFLNYNEDSDPLAERNYKWADSVFKSLSPRQRLGQLFMVAAYSNKDEKHFQEIDKLVGEYNIGGLIFMQGGPIRQANLTNRWQNTAKVPLMLAMDAEWGLAMRLDSVAKYPKQMTLGALSNDSLIYAMGQQIALQTKRIGMQVNFAPVADVNNNPNNPVINTRSFGENKNAVSRKAIAYMRGLQDEHVLATGKHFPGHGDTDADSHHALPIVNHSLKRLDTLELVPFKNLFDAGLGSIMVAHLFIPSLDTTTNTASTLSKAVVTELLQNKMAYRGLIFTDALNMKGVAQYFKPGEVDFKALLAGNDMLLFSEDVPTAIAYIDSAIVRGEISQEFIDERCKKILRTKEWLQLNERKDVETKNLYEDLNPESAAALNRIIRRESITLIKNKDQALPLNPRSNTLYIALGEEKIIPFYQQLANHTRGDFLGLPKNPSAYQINMVLDTASYYDQIVLAIVNTNILARKNFGFTDEGIQLCEKLILKKPSHLVAFLNPYALQRISALHSAASITIGYQDDAETQIEAAEILAGLRPALGKLPVSIDKIFRQGAGLSLKSGSKPVSVHPFELGIQQEKLKKIDEIAMEGLKAEAYPGCQILAAKDGKIFYQKNFGYQQYKNKSLVNPGEVSNQNLYDLASLTKILSTTIACIKMVDEGKLDLKANLGKYLPWIPAQHPHRNVLIKDVLLHQAGFPAWIPFYKKFSATDSLRNKWFSSSKNEKYSWQVAADLYTSAEVKDQIFQQIWDAPFEPNQGYKYSDISFMYLKEVVESLSGVRLDQYVDSVFYRPMGLARLLYRPLDSFKAADVVPTEYDAEFRKQAINGYVHDPGAALLNGVSGHAGLFGNSYAVACIMQMLVDEGKFNGQQMLKKENVKLFTSAPEPGKTRRGYGFDKPTRDGSNGPTFGGISVQSFGHSGFTGTFAWADPSTKVVYVFLSNRVYPSAENGKLVKLGIRSRVHEAIYKALP